MPASAYDPVRVLSETPLFGDCDKSLLASAAPGCRILSFAPGEPLQSYGEHPSLFVLIYGSAAVCTKDTAGELLLRILHSGDTFGVANLFAAVPQVTRVVAEEPTVALCVDEATVRTLIGKDPGLAMRYIAFLSDRIRFLNKRIACLGAGSATARLAAWLDASIPDSAPGQPVSYTIPMPMYRLADVLGLGRASLYRAMEELVASGHLIRDGHTVTVPDRAAFRAMFMPD